MSWFARSIVNSLNLNDQQDDDDDDNIQSSITKDYVKSPSKNEAEDSLSSSQSSETQQGRGVKEDLSELTKTLTRQFWGVASFLAPPVYQPDSNLSNPPDYAVSYSNISDGESSDHDAYDAVGISGIRSDFAEIGGRFKTGITKLSSNMAVSEITKIASNFLQFGADQDVEKEHFIGGAVGVTEEVLAFVRNIALHPETWLDFPFPDEEQDADDFDMSDAQQAHTLAIERLAPELAAIRIEICPQYMSEECFWKIYFVLLHPRLDKDDAELLSTPQIMQARAMLTVELQKQFKTEAEPNWLAEGAACSNKAVTSHETLLSVPSAVQSEEKHTPLDETTIDTSKTRPETEKHPDPASQIQIVDKSIVKNEGVNPSRVLDEKDDDDDWLKEENSDITGITKTNTIPIVGNEEDVSFSDFEEDDDDVPTSSHKKVIYSSDSSTKDVAEWVQLSRSSTDSAKDIETAGASQVQGRDAESKESNEWLDINDIDTM